MTGNISKQKREELLCKIAEIKRFIESVPPDSNTSRLIDHIAELEKEICGTKYGLVFEEHRENIDEILENNIPVFNEQKDLFVHNGEHINYIMEGDNLAALNLMQKTHMGRVDIVYIDPPYNTGKGFIYNDALVETTDTFRYSKWASFIKPRLELARRLLKESGVIFISIDDCEQATLKLICDAVFNESNFIACMPQLTKKQGKNQQSTYASNHDYLLCYAKCISKAEFGKKDAPSEDYPLKDEYYEERGGYKLNQTLDYDTLGYVVSLDYPIELGNEIYYAGSVTAEEYERRKAENPKDGFRWRWSKELFEFGLKNGFIVVKKSKNGNRIYTKTYYKAKIEKADGGYFIDYIDRTISHTTLEYVDNKYSNDNAKKNIDAFDLPVKFDYSKPVSLIKHIVSLCKNKNAVVLDFFAGSGTTGQAVMQLNAEDGGSRSFILCTNNENRICREITYERIKRVIAQENYDESVKYYKIDYIQSAEKLYHEYADELLNHVRELVELENGINFTENGDIAIVLTECELDAFIDSQTINRCTTIYLAHNVLPNGSQERLIKDRGIVINIIPEYYYGTEEK